MSRKKILIVPAEEPVVKKGNGTWHRLVAVKKYLSEHDVDVLVLSGGIYALGQTSPASAAMHNWLIRQAIKNDFELHEQKVIEENQSRDTYENIIFSLSLVDASLNEDNIIVLSERSHLRRIRYMMKKIYNLRIQELPVDYKKWLGRLKERALYFYTKIDPKYQGPLALYNKLVLRRTK